MKYYFPERINITPNVLIVGGLFSVFSGVYELYQTTKAQQTINVLMRVSAHMTAGFIYGMSLSYFWQIPVGLSVYKLGEGFYGTRNTSVL
jgi:hypothetical protein